MKNKIFLKIDSSHEFGFRAYVAFETRQTNPDIGGFAKLKLLAKGQKVAVVIIDWPRAKLHQGPKGDTYLVADGHIDQVEPALDEDTDLTQLIVEAMRRQKNWVFFTGHGPEVDRNTFGTQFKTWVEKNL